MAYYPDDGGVRITGETVPYIWGDRMIKFCHCKACGCLTHYEDVELTPDSRVALNGNMLPPDLLHNLRVRKFDGADTFREID